MSAVLFTLVVLIAGSFFAYTLYGRFRLLAAARPVDRFDRIPERIAATLVYAFGQKKFVVGEQPAGWLHFFIFWGFMILGVQVTTLFARAYSDHFYLPGLSPHLLGGPVMLLRDLMELIVFVSLLIALYRWIFSHPQRLFGFRPAEGRLAGQSHTEAWVILLFIMAIVLGGLVYDGGRLVYLAGDPHIEAGRFWEPVSGVVGQLLSSVFGVSGAKFASDVAWWTHNLVILTFLNMLPQSKHFHVITGIPNVFFMKMEPTGALDKMDLENSERFGTSQIDQFSWKQMLDMFSCTECGRCSSQCPATASGKPLAPRQLLLDLRDYLYEHPEQMGAQRAGDHDGVVKENIVGSVVHDDVLWSC